MALPAGGAFTKWLSGRRCAIPNTTLAKFRVRQKDSLFSAEQGSGRKLLNLLVNLLQKCAREAGIVRNLQEFPVNFPVLRE
jgi:hypothetical protein